MLRAFYLITFVLGLLLGVRAMLVGIARSQAAIRRAPLFNLSTIGSLLAVLGGTGYLLDRYTGLAPAVQLAIASVVGIGAAIGTFSLIAGWAVPSAARDPDDPRFELQGHPGAVVQALPAGGEGVIEFELDDQRRHLPARSLSGEPIEIGAEIVIERVEDGVAHVELWSVIERQMEEHH